MSQHRTSLINGAVLVAVVGALGCQPMVPTTPAARGAAPQAPGYGLQAARPNANANANSQAGAAAEADPCATPPFTVTAKNPNALFTMAGTRNRIEGNVWTNDGIRMTGNREVITGNAHFRDDVTIQGTSNYIGGKKTRETGDAAFDHPSVQELLTSGGRVYRFDSDVDLRKLPVWEAPNVLRPGIYYSTGKITVPNNHARGTATFIASSVQLPGGRHNIKAFAKGVLAYATGYGANAIHLAGNIGTYEGSFITPNGEFQMTGNSNLVKGTVWCDSFKIAGGYNRIVNAGTNTCATAAPVATPTPTPVPSPSPSPVPSPSPEASEPASPSPEPSLPPSPSPSPSPIVASPTPAATTPPEPTSFNSEFTDFEPMDVAANSSSFLFTSNNAGGSMNKITPQGSIDGTPTPIGFALRGVAVASDDTIWLAANDGRIVHMSATGTQLGETLTFGGGASRIRIDKVGNLWVPSHLTDRVWKLSKSGQLLATYPIQGHAMDVAFDSKNTAYVSTSNSIVHVIPSGMTPPATYAGIEKFSVGLGTSGWGITVDPYDNVWVALSRAGQVAKAKRKTDGTWGYTTHGAGPGALGIAADALGNVWVSNFADNSVMKIAQDGAMLERFTNVGGPHGVSVDKKNGRVYVANQIGRTVTIIQP